MSNSYKPSFRIFKMCNGKKKVAHVFESDNYDTALKYFQEYYEFNLKDKDPDSKYYFEMVREYFCVDDKDNILKKYDDLHPHKYTYTNESRKMDIAEINHFMKNLKSNIAHDTYEQIKVIENTLAKFVAQHQATLKLIQHTDVKTAPEEQMDKITQDIRKTDELKGQLENYINLIKDKHEYNEWWSIDYHMLNDLRYNLPILIKKLHGYPTFLEEHAKKEGKEPFEIWKDELKNLLLNVNLYLYYSSYGHVDKDDKQLQEIHKEYKDTIPIHEGTRHDIDYLELGKLTNKHWDFIWDWMKKYGQSLWD